ncbi:MAG: UDP-3-O-(3-hydroxymyristoyl)glucosamine N-acyltransferase [Candidatus Puniceispirillaceae bacterium]
MAVDPHFYQISRPIASSQLADITQGALTNGRDVQITHACRPEEAKAGALIFIQDTDFIEQIGGTSDITIITTAKIAPLCPSMAAIFVADNPRLAFAQVIARLYQEHKAPCISESAQIAPSAKIGKNVSIGAYAIIEEGVSIGEGCVIGPHVVIGRNCVIGTACDIGAHAVILYSRIGNDVKIGPHSVIGKEGFGFEMTSSGAVHLPHLGLVEIHDKCAIGAHCAIDRGVLGNTIIGQGSMMDNLVHIAHNVRIGKTAIILGQVGIAGSAVIGNNCILAGQVGIKDHVTIADGAIILSAAKVLKDIDKAGNYGGNPAVPATQHWREVAAIKALVKKRSKEKDK